ncbi:MAG: leucine-rich repeat protein, partial [Lachnospiraceae bacterium]|nr:leucine-rich repeat protein [Lachnospiraceae bacterium]
MNRGFVVENGILKAYTGADPEISIPEGVEEIGEGVFKGMAWLLKVQLPSTLKIIGPSAFKGCRQLTGLVFPEGLTKVGDYAFHRCHSLTEMIFPENMTEVGHHAFLYCDHVKKVVMEGPKSLKTATFSHNMALCEISLNKDLDDSNFNDEVFEGCVCLHTIRLSGETFVVDNLIEAMDSHSEYPVLIRSVAKSVYHSLQIEDGVLRTFNINLKNVILPEGIKTIGKGCFFDKKGIVGITLPKSLKEIKANAFLNCTSLEEITLQSGELLFDEKAFRGCCNLKKVVIEGKTYMLEDEPDNATASGIRDQVLADFYISGNILVRYTGDEEQITIPKEVEIIGERCFFGNERLKIVTCPKGLREIREEAFSGCVALQNVNLSDGLKRIEKEAFAECKKLLKCSLPENLEFIGEYAFRRCLTLLPFDPWPHGAKTDPYAFYKAKHFEKHEEKLKEKEKTVAGGFPEGITEAEQIAPYAYTNCTGVRSLRLKNIKRIGRYAFAGHQELEEIEIDAPDCVIERDAFTNCKVLRKARVRVKEMETGVFSYCRRLEEVSLSGISALPRETFAGCVLLNTFEAKELTRMDAKCFGECIKLDSFDFSGIGAIGERAFERCDTLTRVDVSGTECGFHAFADCSALKEVVISQDTVLKSGAFTGCTRIRTVVYNGRAYTFDSFRDGLNHRGNPYPVPVRELISSVWSCFDIRDRKRLMGYDGDASGITLPADIEEIGQDAFRDHIRLKEIDIPASVTAFGSHAFSATAWLEEKRKDGPVIINGILLDGASCKGAVTVPDGVKRIASWCFAGNIDITEFTLPRNGIAVESLSFRNCINLKKITDPQGNVYVLKDVSDLKTAGYPELVQRIFSEAINCFKLDDDGNLTESTGNITRLIFPEGIRAIGEGVYKDCHLL